MDTLSVRARNGTNYGMPGPRVKCKSRGKTESTSRVFKAPRLAAPSTSALGSSRGYRESVSYTAISSRLGLRN